MKGWAYLVVVTELFQQGFVLSLQAVGGIFLKLLVGGGVVEDVVSEGGEGGCVHDDGGSSLVCWGNGDGWIILQFFKGYAISIGQVVLYFYIVVIEYVSYLMS